MNNWRKESDEYWHCALWDVMNVNGAWWSSDSLGDDKYEHGPFASPEEAMAWCDKKDRERNKS